MNNLVFGVLCRKKHQIFNLTYRCIQSFDYTKNTTLIYETDIFDGYNYICENGDVIYFRFYSEKQVLVRCIYKRKPLSRRLSHNDYFPYYHTDMTEVDKVTFPIPNKYSISSFGEPILSKSNYTFSVIYQKTTQHIQYKNKETGKIFSVYKKQPPRLPFYYFNQDQYYKILVCQTETLKPIFQLKTCFNIHSSIVYLIDYIHDKNCLLVMSNNRPWLQKLYYEIEDQLNEQDKEIQKEYLSMMCGYANGDENKHHDEIEKKYREVQRSIYQQLPKLVCTFRTVCVNPHRYHPQNNNMLHEWTLEFDFYDYEYGKVQLDVQVLNNWVYFFIYKGFVLDSLYARRCFYNNEIVHFHIPNNLKIDFHQRIFIDYCDNTTKQNVHLRQNDKTFPLSIM